MTKSQSRFHGHNFLWYCFVNLTSTFRLVFMVTLLLSLPTPPFCCNAVSLYLFSYEFYYLVTTHDKPVEC